MPEFLTQLPPDFVPKSSRGSQGRVERTGLGEEHRIWVRVPFIRPLSRLLSRDRGSLPPSIVPVSHSSHSGPSAIALPDSPTEAITMHNDALRAAEECRQRSTECISGPLLRKRDL